MIEMRDFLAIPLLNQRLLDENRKRFLNVAVLIQGPQSI